MLRNKTKYSQHPSKCKAPFPQTTLKMQPLSWSELFSMAERKSANRNGRHGKLRKRGGPFRWYGLERGIFIGLNPLKPSGIPVISTQSGNQFLPSHEKWVVWRPPLRNLPRKCKRFAGLE